MADRELWRKNLPEDFQGKHGENWDDEVQMAPIVWSSVAVVVSVVAAFVFCWWMMGVMDGFQDEPQFSPIAEANERRLPPTPWLQPKPEVELDEMLEQLEERMAGYGWSDQLEGMVHIPVEEAKEIVLAGAGTQPVAVEPSADEPVDADAAANDAAANDGAANDGAANDNEPVEDSEAPIAAAGGEGF